LEDILEMMRVFGEENQRVYQLTEYWCTIRAIHMVMAKLPPERKRSLPFVPQDSADVTPATFLNFALSTVLGCPLPK
jgi:hypothetical protein